MAEIQAQETTTPSDGWRYLKELPSDRTRFARAWKLLEEYSGIPPGEIEAHVGAVRDKAFAVFNYPCLGRWRFLDIYLASTPEYPEITARLKAGAALLDVGCCFGQVLRQLAFDGVPASNLTGTDLCPEFIELGYELFRDKGRFGARFVTGSVLDPDDAALASLDGQFDIVHAASFFHLFGWDDQVEVGQRIVRFLKPGVKDTLVVGRQLGSHEPLTVEEARAQEVKRYLHNVETLQKLWDVIGEKTGTKWKVTGKMFDVNFENIVWAIIRFAVFRVD